MLLERAYGETVASGVLGASTALILSLSDNVLELPYIGDITFVVLHESKIMFLSPAATALFPHHAKEASLLLRCHPTETTSLLHQAPTIPFQLSAKGGSRRDGAKAGQFAVRAGDVVVVGTDGMFVNILEEHLELAV
jgi:protein phosphatase PTC7